MIRFDTVAFDLDGTLADTAPDLAAALNHALGHLGRPPVPPEDVRHLVGHGARALLHKGLEATGGATTALVDAGFPVFLAHYEANICVGTRAFPGLQQALDRLAGDGVRLAICTNKLEGLARQLVDALGWRDLFPVIVGGDTLAVRKPDPRCLTEAIARVGGSVAAYVGDSITDTDTARAAAIPCVAVTFGFSDRPAEQLGADLLIDHYDQLLPALARL
jgi:phosphoglycolate phosphatase